MCFADYHTAVNNVWKYIHDLYTGVEVYILYLIYIQGRKYILDLYTGVEVYMVQ